MAHEKETLKQSFTRNDTKRFAGASQNPSDAGAIAGLAGAEGLSVKLWDAFLPFPAILISKPIKTWPTSKKN